MKNRDRYLLCRYLSLCSFIILMIGFGAAPSFAQPINNNCNNALEIPIGNSGFATGVFFSDTIDISTATMQAGETVPQPIFVAGQYQKSIWYKFTIATSRQLKVSLDQPGIGITSGDVGFTIYKTNNCLPVSNQISNKLTPLETFGSTYHPCVDSGEYLVQITSKLSANGPVFIKLEVDPVVTPYDDRGQAFLFGLMDQPRKSVIYDVECFSKESVNETCGGSSVINNDYTKTSWHTFSTPSYFDYITFLVAAGNSPYFTNVSTQHIIGYRLYQGDAQTTPISGLILIDGCDTLKTNGAKPAFRTYRCGQLDTSKIYSLQLFFRNDFNSSIRVGLFKEGVGAAKGPVASVSWLQPDNQLGVLPYGLTTRSDYFACNGRHATNSCGNSKTPNGIIKGGIRYNVSTYFTFTLTQSANVNLTVYDPPGSTFCKKKYIRVFNSPLSNNCTTLDTLSIYKEYFNDAADTLLRCLQPGSYTIQVMGSEDILTTLTKDDVINSTASACMYGNLGQQFKLSVNVVYTLGNNNYQLDQTGAYDKINGMAPLLAGNIYSATTDTFGCSNAVLPVSFSCPPAYKKAMYREFTVTDSVSVSLNNLNTFFVDNLQIHNYCYEFFKGDANALATAQNVWSYPNTFTGLTPLSNCILVNPVMNNETCLVPGTYTLATYGTDFFVNRTDKPNFVISQYVTQHYSQATVGNLGSIVDSMAATSSSSYFSPLDYFSCRNNAITIAGVAPCAGATKAIYREFYLSQPTGLGIGTNTTISIFSGRLSTVGFAGLTPYLTCINGIYLTACQAPSQIFPAGWYTVVSYGSGSSYDNPVPGGNIYGSSVGVQSSLVFNTMTPCAAPSFNRPFKAAINPVTNAPFLVQWNAAAASTAYPLTSQSVTFPTEHFNCIADTPFSTHPIVPCLSYQNRVAYYVFQLTQECYLNFGLGSGSNNYKLYKADVRTDSMLFPTLTPVYACNTYAQSLEICNAQPGIYTLVIFSNSPCTAITPSVYVDRADKSRFDHAAKAYDFAMVPATNTYYNGRVGDVNPLNPLRAPSNDFFYCSTGARNTDPVNAVCGVVYNANIYNLPDTNLNISSNTMSRRNLWYTFQLTKPGTVKIKVDNKTAGKMNQLPFAVYRTDAPGTTPFNVLVANGQVDSTITQGLTFIKRNDIDVFCQGTNELSFNVPACNFTTQRYYILVDNRSVYGNIDAMRPNHQTEVSVLVDSVGALATHSDYYITATDMDTLGLGNHIGPPDLYTCATANVSYPITMPACAQKTIWYKFTVDTGIAGTAKIRLKINNSVYIFGSTDFFLFREIIQGDSTATGLSQTHLTGIPNYMQGCVSPGTYYLVLTGCNKTNETVFPEILIQQNTGDYCDAPLVATIAGPGSASATALIDCHTIGTDYGEMGNTLSCPVNGITGNYKTSWFRVDVTGSDTLDLSLSLAENTNATSAQIHYRMMTGNCNAMQEQSCVPDAQTQNTYECLVPGNSYYIQVFVPVSYFNNDPAYPTMGTVTLNVSAVEHADTCLPMNNCLVNANFIPSFDCNTSDSVFFNNFSTFGNSIDYLWDFGYNSQTSTAVSPAFHYPALSVPATYNVTLRAVNTDCIDTSYSVQTITIPARPEVNLGNDTATCIYGESFLLHATSYPGSVYLWQNGATDSVFSADLSGHHTYSVAVTYQGCTAHDSIDIYISPLVAQPLHTILICDNQVVVTADATRPFAGTSYLWNTSETTSTIDIGTPGVYWADVTLEGCTVRDSFIVEYNVDTLSVLGNDTAICHFVNGYTLNAAIAGASAYQWQDNSISPQFTVHAPDTYWVMVTINGCAYTDSINITSLPLPQSHVYDTVCYNSYYILPSADTAFTAGLYQDTLAVANSCDSVVNTHLFVRDSIYAVAYDTLCSNLFPIVWNGITVNSGGPNAATFISQSSSGCDSTTSLNLYVQPTSNTVLNQQICIYSLPYNFLGNNLTASGTYFDTLSNAHGCDSFIILNLSVVLEYRDTVTQQICAGGNVQFYDSVYHDPGYYTHSFASNSGCDSFKTLHLLTSPLTPPPVVVSPVAYCLGEPSIPLSATGTALLWYSNPVGGTGSTTPPTPNTAVLGQQVYYVSQTINGCESERDSIIVWVNERPDADFTVVPDHVICSADSVLVTFTGIQPAGSIQVWDWDGGNVSGTDPGPYQVRWNTGGLKNIVLWVDNGGCISDTVIRSVEVNASPAEPSIQLPDYVCVHDTITVYGVTNNANALFNWTYNGTPISAGTSFNMSWPEPGWNYFSLYLTDNGCDSKLTLDSVLVVNLPSATITYDSSKICNGEIVKLNAASVEANSLYKWSPKDYFPGDNKDEGPEVNVVVNKEGWIVLNVTNAHGCENADSVFVDPEYCCKLYLPNAFSPNGDGLNDVFKPQTEERQDVKEFAIYNRYGQRVFLAHSQDEGWDGTQNGKMVDIGTYYFYIRYVCIDGNSYFKKGDVILMR